MKRRMMLISACREGSMNTGPTHIAFDYDHARCRLRKIKYPSVWEGPWTAVDCKLCLKILKRESA